MNTGQPEPDTLEDIIERVERIEHVLFDAAKLSPQKNTPDNEVWRLENESKFTFEEIQKLPIRDLIEFFMERVEKLNKENG